MKSLLFALGLALCCFVQANQDERFERSDLRRFIGDWNVRAIATDCQKVKEMFPRMPASPISFKQMSPDELKMTMVIATPQGCRTMTPMLKRENGVFTSTCGNGVKKTVEMINLNENFMSVLVTISHQNGQCTMATLLSGNRPRAHSGLTVLSTGRDLEDLTVAIEDFKAFVARNGPEGEEIHILPTKGDQSGGLETAERNGWACFGLG
ncbi:extracellular fatty acid-binding protein-like [Ahaetulla prasina]|uniref:extracellular fatty acid-binding protein-like n=1 Tax=Ahaetulla prasina TaxID=499056 RepID=UPI0026482256|nr:extracellular fatty acid-binding protein-like [Ahaetulla prasina]